MTVPGSAESVTAHRGHRDLTTDHRVVRMVIGSVTVLAAALVVGEHRGDPIVAVLLGVTVLVYGLLADIDVAEQRLPNRFTLPLAGAAMLAVAFGGFLRSDVASAIAALGTGFGFAALLLVLRFGMGDVKFVFTVGVIAGWFGRDAIMATAYIGAGTGALAALVLIVVYRRRDLAFGFGPFLSIGSIGGMLVAA